MAKQRRVMMCPWCGRYKVKENVWEKYTPKENDDVSHGPCPDCLEKQLKMIRENEEGK